MLLTKLKVMLAVICLNAIGPAMVGQAAAPIPQVVGQLKAGDEKEFEIAAGVKMKFCWIPTAECQLGSQKAERDAVRKQYTEMFEQLKKAKQDMNVQPDLKTMEEMLDAEAEEVRGKFSSKGFWLGKYPVTQGEWKAVMGENPSWFQPEGRGKDKLQKDKIMDTSRFPVEFVSWEGCQEFLEKLNKRGGTVQVFGQAGKFVLPHENEWEFASRGGKGNKQPYYWGNELNGTQANCHGMTEPYGTETKGQFLGRTCAVDDTNGGKYEKHPWGLCHILGNVFQWCENKSSQSKDEYVLCGGSWLNFPRNCRSAFRLTLPNYRFGFDYGFRVCLRPDPPAKP